MPLTPENGNFFHSVPKGIILSWFTTTSNVPPGWSICDGTNGTPDLRSHFLIGVGSDADVGKPFGQATHGHSMNFVSDTAFAHSDAYKIDNDRSCCPQVTGLAHQHNIIGSTDQASSIPPSVGVLFIMKIVD